MTAINTGEQPWRMEDVECRISRREPGPSAEYPDLLFEDDFSTGDFSKCNDYFRWGHGDVIPPGTVMGYPDIGDVTGPHGTAIKAMRFTYKNPGDWPERRFHLTDSLGEVRGGSGNGPGLTHHREVWVAFDFFTPADIFHDDIEGADNNKLWVTLWKNAYGHSAGISDVWASTETYPALDGTGTSYVQYKYRSPGGGTPNRTNPDFRAPEQAIPASDRAYAITVDQRGSWARYAIGVRCADPGGANGWFRVYRNGSKIIGFENVNNSNTDPDLNGFDRGYLMGWANAAYTSEVTFLIANFAVGITPESVGISE